jgi:hypothetical protein
MCLECIIKVFKRLLCLVSSAEISLARGQEHETTCIHETMSILWPVKACVLFDELFEEVLVGYLTQDHFRCGIQGQFF